MVLVRKVIRINIFELIIIYGYLEGLTAPDQTTLTNICVLARSYPLKLNM